MSNVVIDRLDPADVETLSHLFNSVFQPSRTAEHFQRRFEGRRSVLVLVARIEQDAVGFFVGFELKPDVFFGWLCGVVSDLRRTGIATQLMHSAIDWARTEGYETLRFECHNHARAFLHFGIANDFDIVGIRWDDSLQRNLVIFEKRLRDS